MAKTGSVRSVGVMGFGSILGRGTSAPAGPRGSVSRRANQLRLFRSIRSLSSLGPLGGEPANDVQPPLAAHGAEIAVERGLLIHRRGVRGFGLLGLDSLADPFQALASTAVGEKAEMANPHKPFNALRRIKGFMPSSILCGVFCPMGGSNCLKIR